MPPDHGDALPSDPYPVPAWVDVVLSLASSSTTSSSSPSSPSSSSSPPSTHVPARHPAAALAAQASLASGLQRVRLALAIVRAPDAPSLASVASDFGAPQSILAMLRDPWFCGRPHDCAAVIVAAHTLTNFRIFQAKFIAAGGLAALARILAPALDFDDMPNTTATDASCTTHPNARTDRVPSRTDEFSSGASAPNSSTRFPAAPASSAHHHQKKKKKRKNRKTKVHHAPSATLSESTERLTPDTDAAESDLESDADSDSDTGVDKQRTPDSSIDLMAHGGIHRVVWNAAIRTIAKLMVISHAACSKAIDTGCLALLAKAAKPGEPIDIRLRADAGLAAIASWSGPRRAIDIVQTPDVVLSMSSILVDQDERIPNDLRSAIIDGLVVMSFRRHVRGILQRYGCEENIKAAARNASVSGDYTAAARSTVAAGHLTGRSIDEYGFMVVQDVLDGDGAESAPETLLPSNSPPLIAHDINNDVSNEIGDDNNNNNDATADDDDKNNNNPNSSPTKLVRRPTGLEQIHQQLLEEPYMQVEELNVLEEIVHEDAGVLSSSPKDRNHVRHAARAGGVSIDEIEDISLLDEEVNASSPSRQTRFGEGTAAEEEAEGGVAQEAERQRNGSANNENQQSENQNHSNIDINVNSSSIDQQQQPSSKPLAKDSATSVNDSTGDGDGPEQVTVIDEKEGHTGEIQPDAAATGVGNVNNGIADQRKKSTLKASTSSTRVSSQLFAAQDPDFDGVANDDDDDEPGSVTTAASSKSKMASPLLMFSSAARKAAEKDKARATTSLSATSNASSNRTAATAATNATTMQKTQSQVTREAEHERKWRHVLEKRPELLRREGGGKMGRVVGYRELAAIPVPAPLRRKLWAVLLDVPTLRESEHAGLYAKLCERGGTQALEDDTEHTIEADVTRTMPSHSLFWSGGAQVGVDSLRRILRAYALHVPDIGYCQGMSSIAAVFLMNAIDEEEAFLMMLQFMTRFQYRKVFAHGFPLMLHWLEELKPLLAFYMPDLDAHLQAECVDLSLYADKWLITALSHNFPHRHLLRVWDLMFLGGSPKIVLKACLMVLSSCRTQLLALDFEGCLALLQRNFSTPQAGVLDMRNPEPFVNDMREFRFMTDIKRLGLTSPSATAGKPPGSRTRPQSATSAAPGAKQKPADKDSTGRKQTSSSPFACFNCFKRSATVD